MALAPGQPAPDFSLKSHTGATVKLSDYCGKNVVLAFFPLAWTPVWTSQIPSYQNLLDRFEGMQTQVLGLSVDSVPCLKAWADSLGGITYPLLSDFYPHGKVAEMFGVLRPEGYTERAIFVMDKQGIICYVDVHDIDTQPDNDELFRVLTEVDPEAAVSARTSQPPGTQTSTEPDAEVILYCTPWCPDCPEARRYFKQHDIPYVEIDISRDRAAAGRVRGWSDGNETTPTINIRGQIIVTFDQAKVAKALGMKR